MADKECKEIKVTVDCDGAISVLKGAGCVVFVPDGQYVRGCLRGNINWFEALYAMREALKDKEPFDKALELMTDPEGMLLRLLDEEARMEKMQ